MLPRPAFILPDARCQFAFSDVHDWCGKIAILYICFGIKFSGPAQSPVQHDNYITTSFLSLTPFLYLPLSPPSISINRSIRCPSKRKYTPDSMWHRNIQSAHPFSPTTLHRRYKHRIRPSFVLSLDTSAILYTSIRQPLVCVYQR